MSAGGVKLEVPYCETSSTCYWGIEAYMETTTTQSKNTTSSNQKDALTSLFNALKKIGITITVLIALLCFAKIIWWFKSGRRPRAIQGVMLTGVRPPSTIPTISVPNPGPSGAQQTVAFGRFTNPSMSQLKDTYSNEEMSAPPLPGASLNPPPAYGEVVQ